MSETLYTPEVREFVRTRKWPRGLIMDVIEYEDYLGFRFYRDNFIQFDGEAQRQIASTIKEVMEKIRGMGIPCYMEKMERVSDGGSGLAT
jgi:hypothetical protein